jgi:light-regulated signal transduction histidine kinase (bacteriophytochrome)
MSVPQSAAAAATHSDAELSEFLLRACHDLRGPLRTIRIHEELLARNRSAGGNESSAFAMSGAIAATAVLDGIIDYALALAIDAAQFQLAPLDIILRSAMAKLAAPLRESAAEVAYGDLPSVRGDSDRLLQLFEYLVDHAIRRPTAKPPRISFVADREETSWVITARDNGTPILLEKAFTPFAKLHANQRPGPGLATCRAIVERHGGTMWAEPSVEGCVIRFTLPTAE